MQSKYGQGMNAEQFTQRVTVDLGDGVLVQMDVVPTDGELQEVEPTRGGQQGVSGGARLSFGKALAGMTKVAEAVATSVQKAKPTKATIKYGMELGVEEGSLMAAIVRGTGNASFEITLEWENTSEKNS